MWSIVIDRMNLELTLLLSNSVLGKKFSAAASAMAKRRLDGVRRT